MSGLLRELAHRNELHLVSVVLEPPRRESLVELSTFCTSIHLVPRSQANWRRAARLLSTLACRRPFILAKHMSHDLRKAVAGVCEQVRPDVLLAEFHYVADSVIAMGVPAVVDLHNIDFRLYDRIARSERPSMRKLHGRIQRSLMARYERQLPHQVDACVTVSDSDQDLLQALSGARNIDVVPNGVDVAYFHPQAAAGIPHDVVFVGSMDYYPNVDGALFLVEELMPCVWAQRPETTVAIVGRSPTRAVRALARDPRVTVTGGVADVRPYVAGGRISVVPVRIGGGSRLKAVEAAAMARPILGTTVGLEGSGLVHDKTALVADAPGTFAEATLRLISDPILSARLGNAAHEFAVRDLSWEACARRLERILIAASGRS